MASFASSSLFARLVSAWNILALRSDVDHIIENLLGRFSLENIYSDGDGEAAKEEYRQLVITLLAQLNTIFYIQRLSLPNESLQSEWYLDYVASWEMVIRSLEFVLQTVVDGRDALFEAPLLIDIHLAEMVLASLRLLTLHPKTPSFKTSRERRERFARVHRLLEQVCDSYAGPHSFLLLVCRETTDSLRTDSDSLLLPTKLGRGLPNLASDLYPLPDCLSPHSIAELIEPSGFGENWLSQLLALRDVAHFVVGASIQYAVKRPSNLQLQLQSSSAKSRAAIDAALARIRLPLSLRKEDARDSFNEIYRLILPGTGAPRAAAHRYSQEIEMDAIVALCKRLEEQQIVHRASDRSMIHCISEISRNIALVEDESALLKKSQARHFVVNCPEYHLISEYQLHLKGIIELPTNTPEDTEITLLQRFACVQCGELVTTIRITSLARYVLDRLAHPDSSLKTISLERHHPGQFQLLPPKPESFLTSSQSYGVSANGSRTQHMGSGHQHSDRINISESSAEQSRSNSQPLPSPSFPAPLRSPGIIEPAQTSFFQLANAHSTGKPNNTESQTRETIRRLSSTTIESPPTTNIANGVPQRQTRTGRTGSNASLENQPIQRSFTISSIAPAEKKSRWTSRFGGSKREPVATVLETSSLSSTTLESQRLEEVSLKNLIEASKRSGSRGKNAKTISVYLSQNSSYALFWTSLSIQIWDVSTSPPSYVREERTGSNCIVAAVTRLYLAYVIGTRDERLTLRIVNLAEPSIASLEYRMNATVFPTRMAICPNEDYVAVGFERPVTVQFFRTSRSTPPEDPREDCLPLRDKNSFKLETLSFSHDGCVLLCSTRNDQNGAIHVFWWHSPFQGFEELKKCQHLVRSRDMEDNGVSAAIFRPGHTAEDDLICITTWTLSGVPLLVQPKGGHKSEIKPESSSGQGKLGSRVHSAAFSPSGRMLAMVNNKGQLYKISHLNSNPMQVRRVAESKPLNTKQEALAMAFMSLPDEEAIVLAWPDLSKGIGYVRKVPVAASEDHGHLETPSSVWIDPQELPADAGQYYGSPVELSGDRTMRSDSNKGKSIERF